MVAPSQNGVRSGSNSVCTPSKVSSLLPVSRAAPTTPAIRRPLARPSSAPSLKPLPSAACLQRPTSASRLGCGLQSPTSASRLLGGSGSRNSGRTNRCRSIVDLPRIALADGPKILRDVDRPSSAASRPSSAAATSSSRAVEVTGTTSTPTWQPKPRGMPLGLKEAMQECARRMATTDTHAVLFIEMMRRPTNPCMRVEYTRSTAFFDYFSRACLDAACAATGSRSGILIEDSKACGEFAYASPLPAGAFEVHMVDVANDFKHTLIHSKILTRDYPDVEVVLTRCSPQLRANSKSAGAADTSLRTDSKQYLRRVYTRAGERVKKRRAGRR